MEWQPIETAPQGRIIVACEGEMLGQWVEVLTKGHDSCWYDEYDNRISRDVQRTAWMPLPKHPND